MDDYISRETAVKYIKSEQCGTCSDIGLCGNCAVLVAVKLLEKVPAADVAEVVHGRWEKEPSSYWRWTSSGAVAVTRTTYRCGLCGRGTAVKSNYCPNCGAKMDGAAK